MSWIPRPVANWGLALFYAGSAVAAASNQPFTIAEEGTFATLAKDERGGFTAAWVSYTLNQVFARRYGPGDRALTAGLSLGAYAYGFPTVGIAATGRDHYRVAWDLIPKYSGGYLVERLLRPGADGRGPLRNLGAFAAPSLAQLGTDGSYAAALLGTFASAGGPRSGVLVHMRSPDGRLRRQIQVAPGFAPHAAPASGGGFWVVWTGPQGTRARRYSSAGEALEGHTLNASPYAAVVAGNRAGELMVAWPETNGTFARWWSPRRGFGPRVAVTAAGAAGITRLSAAMDAEGKSLLVWGACCSPPRVEGRRFEARGRAAGGAFRVREGGVHYPAAAAGPAGDFVVAWDEAGGIRGQSLPWARPGDELCLVTGGQWRCDSAHDGGQAELEQAFGGLAPGQPLLGDLDADGRDDLCLLRGERLLCDTAHDAGAAELKLPAPLAADEIPLLGDLDGEGRDDLCGWRADRLECDTAHNGGTAEVVVELATHGTPMLADWDGDGDDDPCAAEAGHFECDLDHDGDPDTALGLPFARADETPLLGDLDGDRRADPCVYDGDRLRCDTKREGDATLELSFPGVNATPLLGNPDGI